MLRALKHAFSSPRLLGLKATTTGGSACTVGISPDDFYSATCDAAGRAILTFKDTFARTPICCGSPFSSDVGASGALLVESDPTALLATLRTHDGTNGDNGSFNAFILGYDDYNTDYLAYGAQLAPFAVKNAWNSPRIELFKVTPHATTPTIDIGGGKATLTRNGVGDYTITFKRPFSSDNVIAAGMVIKTTAAHFHVVSCTALAVRVLVGAAGSASDAAPFYLVIQGSDNPQYGTQQRKVTRVSDRLPRLIAGHVSWSAGTPSIIKGTGDFTIVDTGTGVLTVTLVNPFAREPLVIANKDTAGLVTLNAAADTDEVVFNAFNGAGAAADPADLHFMIFGYDAVDEYAI